ncbi:AAA family ATPase [Bacillus sp. N447-1]|uniref:AAA family ATPase n=1 Tax=Bacillus sp. N447-1 TaxID=2789208 RepID=UPI001F60BFD2|nr:AAA family ATPase [Bacillus sp. N447-1]UNT70189.1 AAA family ATPase [Bacillus sp. N447-1]
MSLKKDLGLFQELYKIYSQSIGRDSYLAFEWRNLSSGETAMLNLYSRFYSLIKQSTFNPNVIILIDEGELYFHPQWQKRFLSSIISFLREIFYGHGVESLQIIMTSNSPFIVSDLPSSNVIFLKRINEDSVVIKNLEGQYKTFAANIHSLFSHSFS